MAVGVAVGVALGVAVGVADQERRQLDTGPQSSPSQPELEEDTANIIFQ